VVAALTRHVRANLIAYFALFVALGGSAYAGVRLTIPPNSVGAAQIKDRAVTKSKLATSALRALRGTPGPSGRQGPQGQPGTDASITGVEAAGDLYGSYPAPLIRSGVITSDKLASPSPWQQIRSAGGLGEPSFQNGWGNVGGDWATAAISEEGVRLDGSDVFHLRGSISGGSVSTSSNGDAFYFCASGLIGDARGFEIPTRATNGLFAPGEIVIAKGAESLSCPPHSCQPPSTLPFSPPPGYCVVTPIEVRVAAGYNGRVSLDGIAVRLGGADLP
jgi:hypothetical protein